MAERTCSVIEHGVRCPKIVHGRGYCSMHYQRWRLYGDPLIRLIAGYGTGRCVEPSGYVKVYRPGHPLATARGWVREHRLVAYEAGLLTDLSMHVHHIDGDKQNNAIANLEILSNSEHRRMHNLARTHCLRGHEFNEVNTRILPNGKRWCRLCHRIRRAQKRR